MRKIAKEVTHFRRHFDATLGPCFSVQLKMARVRRW